MKHRNLIAIDLAKSVFQVVLIDSTGKLVSNKELSRSQLKKFLMRQPPSIVAFEACANMHFWGMFAQEHKHAVRAIPPGLVKAYRQGHKTDANDALAIAEAAQRPGLKVAPVKTPEELQILQINTFREQLVKEKTAIGNRIRALLSEYDLVISKSFKQLKIKVPEYLEDADNRLPGLIREIIALLLEKFRRVEKECKQYNQVLKALVKQHKPCQRLIALEGVGEVGATLLYAKLGDGTAFKNGREASAYIGLTPKQSSSGGKVVMLGIGKHNGEQRLRSVLIQGAMSVVSSLKEPKTKKQKWLFALIQRSGKMNAAVALANKNVRTALAMLKSGEGYRVA